MTDLETLVEAVSHAIRNQAPAITRDDGCPKRITLEFELSERGEVGSVACRVERRGHNPVIEEQLRVTTEAQRERLHGARKRGGSCSACGRTLSSDEAVYIEQFAVGGRRPSYALAPVGVECASSACLRRAEGTEPDRCVACGRCVYYCSERSNRGRAVCSRHCASQRNIAKRAVTAGVEGRPGE